MSEQWQSVGGRHHRKDRNSSATGGQNRGGSNRGYNNRDRDGGRGRFDGGGKQYGGGGNKGYQQGRHHGGGRDHGGRDHRSGNYGGQGRDGHRGGGGASDHNYNIRFRGQVTEDEHTGIFLPHKTQLQWGNSPHGTLFVLDCHELFETRLPNTNTQRLADAISSICEKNQKFLESFSLYASPTAPKFYLNFLKGCGPFVIIHLYNNPKHGALFLRYKKFSDDGEWLQFESTTVKDAYTVMERLDPPKMFNKTIWVVQNRLKFSALLCIRQVPEVGTQVLLGHMRESPDEEDIGWIIPTGCIEEGQSSIDCAVQAFCEKTGFNVAYESNRVFLDGKLNGPYSTYSSDYIELMVWHVARICHEAIADLEYTEDQNPDLDQVKWLSLKELADEESLLHQQLIFTYRRPIYWLSQVLPPNLYELEWITDWIEVQKRCTMVNSFSIDIRNGYVVQTPADDSVQPVYNEKLPSPDLQKNYNPQLLITTSQSTKNPLEISVPGHYRMVTVSNQDDNFNAKLEDIDTTTANSVLHHQLYNMIEPALIGLFTSKRFNLSEMADPENPLIVTWRFNLSQLGKTMTERTKEWLIELRKENGILYMYKHHLLLSQLRNSSEANSRYEAFCTSTPNNLNQLQSVVLSTLAGHKMAVIDNVGAVLKEPSEEVDNKTVTMPSSAESISSLKSSLDTPFTFEDFVSMKETSSKRRFYETWKLSTWLQNFIMGIPRVRVGISNGYNLVREEIVDTGSIADTEKIREKGLVMLNFIGETLTILKQNLEEGKTYFLYHPSNEDKLHLFSSKDPSRRPSWFQ